MTADNNQTTIGILGCGVISRTYLRDIRRLFPQLQVKAVADLDREKARELADEFQIAIACTPDELLSDPEITLVVNLTPPLVHTQINRQILTAGKHLYCEKPFALTLEEALETAGLAEKNGLLIGCAPDCFLGSGLSTCRKLLDDGMIGRPLYAAMNMMNIGVETWHPQPENFYRRGGGPLYDMGGYYFTPLVHFFGPVESVFSWSAKGFPQRTVYTKERFGQLFDVEVPTHYAVMLRLRSGMLVTANFSFDIWKTSMPMFEIYGTEGTLEVPDPNMYGGTPRLYRKEQKLAACYGGEVPDADQSCPLPELAQNIGTYIRGLGVKDLADAIRSKTLPRANVRLAIHVTDIITSIIRSAEEGGPVCLTTGDF